MINSILELHIYLVILITVIAGTTVSFFALKLIRKRKNWESFKENHEVGGFLFNALGLIYAALVAFVVLATWEEYNTAKANCEKESNKILGLYFLSEGLPGKYKPVLKKEIQAYLKDVIENDWPLLAAGEVNNSSGEKLKRIWNIFEGMDIDMNAKQYIIFTESINNLNSVTEYRRLRILNSKNHIPSMMLAVILIGSMTSIGFSLFFGTKSFKLQAVMTSLFAVTNIFIILLILNLDNPFSGDLKIRPDVYIETMTIIDLMN